MQTEHSLLLQLPGPDGYGIFVADVDINIKE